MRYLSNLNLERNQLQNAALHPTATPPSNPVLGQVYFSTLNDENTLYIWNGTTWESVGQLLPNEIVALINNATDLIEYSQVQVIPLGTHTSGDYVATLSAGDGLVANGVGEAAAVTIAHADTSSQASVDNINGTVIQDVQLDGFGHVTSLGSYNLDNRYYTETESDARFAPIVHTHVAASITDFDTEVANNVDVAANTAARHNQNTDLGTSSATFYIGGATGPKVKNSFGVIEARNNNDDGYAEVKFGKTTVEGDLEVKGTITAIKSTEVDIGDNKILLNANITTEVGNVDGGLAIKRFNAAAERKDAEIYYSESNDRWNTISANPNALNGLVTRAIANKFSTTFGNGADTTFTIDHYLNTRDFTVSIRRNIAPYDIVYSDIEATTLDSVTIRTAVAPSSGEYTITIIG